MMSSAHTPSTVSFAWSTYTPRYLAINGLICDAEGRDLAKHLGCIFMETSTKQSSSVDQAFYSAVREIRKYNKVCLSRVDFRTG
jgi:hypothetical protein